MSEQFIFTNQIKTLSLPKMIIESNFLLFPIYTTQSNQIAITFQSDTWSPQTTIKNHAYPPYQPRLVNFFFLKPKDRHGLHPQLMKSQLFWATLQHPKRQQGVIIKIFFIMNFSFSWSRIGSHGPSYTYFDSPLILKEIVLFLYWYTQLTY